MSAKVDCGSCFKDCDGSFFFVPGPNTRDGKSTSRVLCSRGIPGGCRPGPGYDQLHDFNVKTGTTNGAPRIKDQPLWVENFTGLRITAGGRQPRSLACYRK